MSNFRFDKGGNEAPVIKRIITSEDSYESNAGKTHRFFSGSYVVKIARDRNQMAPSVIKENIKVISSLGISFPDSIYGRYNLSNIGFSEDNPVLMQEQVRDFKSTLNNKKMSEATLRLLGGAVQIIDTAARNKVVLDNSLPNFGLKGKNTVLLDFQDKSSVNANPSEEEIREMYQALLNSLHDVEYDKEFKPELFIEEKSDFL